LLLECLLVAGELLCDFLCLIQSLSKVACIHRGQMGGQLFQLIGGLFTFSGSSVSVILFQLCQSLLHRLGRLLCLITGGLTGSIQFFELFLNLGQLCLQLFLSLGDFGW